MNKINDLKERPLSVAEAARELGVSRTKVKDMMLTGEIDFEVKLGPTPRSNTYKISYQSCVNWLKKNDDQKRN